MLSVAGGLTFRNIVQTSASRLKPAPSRNFHWVRGNRARGDSNREIQLEPSGISPWSPRLQSSPPHEQTPVLYQMHCAQRCGRRRRRVRQRGPFVVGRAAANIAVPVVVKNEGCS